MPRKSSRRPKSFPDRAWRALRRAVAGRPRTPWFLPLAALVLVAAMLAGLMLGNSVVSAIDPLALRRPDRPPRLLPDEPPSPQRADSASEAWFDAGDCGPGCAPHPGAGFGAMTPPPDVKAAGPGHVSPAEIDAAVADARRALGPAFPETRPDSGVAGGPIQRYSDFPVSDEEAAERDGAAALAPGAAGRGSGDGAKTGEIGRLRR